MEKKEVVETLRLTYVRQAESAFAADPEVEPKHGVLMARGHGAARYLRNLQRTEPDAPFLYVPGTKVLFSELIEAQSAETVRIMGEPGARIPAPARVQRAKRVEVDDALEEARGAMRRVRGAVEGSGVRTEEKRRVANHLFAELASLPDSRNGVQSALSLLIGRIQGLGEEAPVPVRELVPLLEEKSRALAEAPDVARGRQRGRERLSKEAVVALMALEMILSDLVSWASAKASDERLREIQRIVMPARRRAGGGDEEGEGTDEEAGKGSQTTPAKPATLGVREADATGDELKKVGGG